MMRFALLLGAGLVTLGACAEIKSELASDAPADAADGRSCGADERQGWVGQSVAALNDVDLPEGTRVLFPTTPATMDYRPERLNVEVNKSDAIARVYCG